MKYFPFLLLALSAQPLFAQTTVVDSFQTKFNAAVCHCFDSIPKKALDENTMAICFQVALENNHPLFIEKAMKLYGDTAEAIGNDLGVKVATESSLQLVGTCK